MSFQHFDISTMLLFRFNEMNAFLNFDCERASTTHLYTLLANHSAQPLKQHEMCEAVTHTFNPDNNTCNVHMQQMRGWERKRLWFLSVYLFLSSLHDCNVWIEPIERAMAMSCHNMFNNAHTPNVDPKDVTFDLKSSNPWISHSVCSMACCTFSSFDRFQFDVMQIYWRKKTLHKMHNVNGIPFNSRIPCFVHAFPKKSSISFSCLQNRDELEHIIKSGLNLFNCSIQLLDESFFRNSRD